MRSHHLLGAGLFALATLIVGYAVLGPLVLDVIHFRTSASGLDQIRGGDLAALAVVAPVCAAVGALAWRGHPAAPVLALAPAIFAMYTYSQLVLANEYLRIPGNVELFFPLLLVMFWLAAALTVRSVGLVRATPAPPWSRRLERGCGVLLVVIAAVVALGLHLPTLVAAMSGNGAAYRDAPTAFWVVKFYDLGLVVPGALVVGIGLLRRRIGARTPASAILGGYVLLGWSVAGMAWTMLVSGDPDGSAVQAVVMTAISAAGSVFAWFLYRPLFRTDAPASLTPAPAGAR
ncbi:MAG: hypothetical protein J0I49_31690 [Pseudonocardia sp.]|uniref:hypothetical protein n=1 Tax=Pseudonocardia sp. TaxID=60912 RepID=UPI001ACF2970|nr:hypothetical protein [Pseudonocardia sp.]MBN9102628.1 hypothetical protein [Pseudonocardia sp.]